jgi:alkylation response protein AidB-like acyl-CoA dehydrogenase
MDFELQAVSDAGRAFVSLCERHESEFSSRATRHDREGSFSAENVADLVRSGVTAATVPAKLGGLGVVLMRDYSAGMSRLGRGDGSTAIFMNMHLWRVWTAARAWRAARLAGDNAQQDALAPFLRQVAAEGKTIAVLSSESGGGILTPMAEAIRDGDGWRLSGRKAFATGCPVADLFAVRFRVKDADGEYRFATALIPADAPGVSILGNWDALGMRASGSHDVVFDDCVLPSVTIDTSGRWGEMTPGYMFTTFSGVLGLVAAFLGIAEAARALSLRQIATHGRGDRPAIQHLIAEMEVDLAATRATLERAAANADAVLDAHPAAIPVDVLRPIVKDIQAAKHFVTRKAIDIVDHAMTLSGGSGYTSTSPLSRLYRDVRAGPFMQPFAPVEALELIGKIALDLPV